ncbi:MAG: DUF2007 domain-containing protein [Alcanivoracaceae bacterium]|nr:DUF2007 domain-containing protein [Alcanivoracaceae bacterium]
MQQVFRADSALEASMIADLLSQAGIHAHIFGAELQGGIGELPAGGNVRVMVNRDDAEQASALIKTWDTAQIPSAATHTERDAHSLHFSNHRANTTGVFIAGIVVGFILCLITLS